MAIFGVIAGFSYYVLTVRNAQRNQQYQLETRQAQLFMQVYRDICTPEWWLNQGEATSIDCADYDEFWEKWGKTTNPIGWSKQSALFAFYEGLGVLVSRKLIDPSIVDDLLSGPIMQYWENLKPCLTEMRTRRNPAVAEWIEYLYNQIQPIRLEQHPELKA